MRFFKSNSYDIVKLYINQIGISIFSLFLYFAVESLPMEETKKTGMAIGLSVFAILFLAFLLYCSAWDMGARDKIRIDSGRMAAARYKGLWLALCANLSNALLAGLSLLLLGINMPIGSEVLASVFVIVNFLLRVTTAMYNGVLQGAFSFLLGAGDWYLFWQTVGLLVLPLIAVGVTQLGYSMGVRDRQILRRRPASRPKE